jgi:hypothetical protein
MINRVEECFCIKARRLIGDTAYGTAAMLGWLVGEKHSQPNIPVWGRNHGKENRLGRSEFRWEAEADRYICPAGKSLLRYRRPFKKPRTGITKDNTIIYRSTKQDCEACELKARCRPKEPARKIHRSIHESARDLAYAIAKTDAYKQARKDRKEGRDAIRTPQTHPEAGSTETGRDEWRQE